MGRTSTHKRYRLRDPYLLRRNAMITATTTDASISAVTLEVWSVPGSGGRSFHASGGMEYIRDCVGSVPLSVSEISSLAYSYLDGS